MSAGTPEASQAGADGAARFVWLNRGKESVALDLSVPAAREALHALLPPLLFDGQALPAGPGPDLGEHPAAVLAELGIDPAAVTP
jgi:crotonobetainyl-CoA:carnitine CoA-transferase CaiB-like acyl-CoA transferase